MYQKQSQEDCERHSFFGVVLWGGEITDKKKHHNLNLSQKCSVFASGIEWNYTSFLHTHLDFDLPKSSIPITTTPRATVKAVSDMSNVTSWANCEFCKPLTCLKDTWTHHSSYSPLTTPQRYSCVLRFGFWIRALGSRLTKSWGLDHGWCLEPVLHGIHLIWKTTKQKTTYKSHIWKWYYIYIYISLQTCTHIWRE